MTFKAICKAYEKVFKQYGHVAVAHHFGDRAITIAYGVKLMRVHRAIAEKIAAVHDVDKKADLKIMHENIDALKHIILEHFKLRHEDLVERVELARQTLQSARAGATRPASPRLGDRPITRQMTGSLPQQSGLIQELFGGNFQGYQ